MRLLRSGDIHSFFTIHRPVQLLFFAFLTDLGKKEATASLLSQKNETTKEHPAAAKIPQGVLDSLFSRYKHQR